MSPLGDKKSGHAGLSQVWSVAVAVQVVDMARKDPNWYCRPGSGAQAIGINWRSGIFFPSARRLLSPRPNGLDGPRGTGGHPVFPVGNGQWVSSTSNVTDPFASVRNIAAEDADRQNMFFDTKRSKIFRTRAFPLPGSGEINAMRGGVWKCRTMCA